jgi:hypothetical protein
MKQQNLLDKGSDKMIHALDKLCEEIQYDSARFGLIHTD